MPIPSISLRSLVRAVFFLVLISCVATGRVFAADETEHQTTTPIKHVVVIFQENVSFDHYFGTYPMAPNPPGEPRFVARRGTPTVNGLTGTLKTRNPNLVNPFRFDRSHAATCDQDHGYKDEQRAFNKGLMDMFVEVLGNGPGHDGTLTCMKRDVMGYFDGNTVTALWNYAQHFAINDNFYGTTFGPSTPGHLSLISGQTHGATGVSGNTSNDIAGGSVVGDPQPAFDNCSTRETVSMSGMNIGNLLNAMGITWGWFNGGFRDCTASHTGSDGLSKGDYIPHHAPFQYYASTSNPAHLPPTSVDMIGHQDQANHLYDIQDFWDAVDAGNLPEISFLKPPAFQDGHAGYSDPLAEQQFLVETINHLQQNAEEWRETAIFITWDDSDGWYDHQMGPIVSKSNTSQDALTGTGMCGTAPGGFEQGKCGFGPRIPLVVVSRFAKQNFVDNTVTDQSSILRFIEDNWSTGRIPGQSSDRFAGSLLNMFDFRGDGDDDSGTLFLDPSTGEPFDDGGGN